MVLLVLKLWLKPHQRQETAWVGRREKQSTGQLLKRKQYRLKKKALQKMRENLKIQRKTIPHKTPLLTISNKEHCIQKSQWGYKETTKDRTLPPPAPQPFKYFLQLKMVKGFIQKKQDRKNFMLLAQNTLMFFHQASRQTNQEKSKWGSL